MPQEKISKSDGMEKRELITAEDNSIIKVLQEEYGISISREDLTAEDMEKRHYRKITGDELNNINQYLKFIPHIVANDVTKTAAEAAFKSATEGTYRVCLGKGTHLCRSHKTLGAYRAVELSDATNKIVGNAELVANDATFTTSNIPQFASGLFDVASMVTGQYFMSQINAKLESLASSVNKLEIMLDAQRRGELKNAVQTLEDVCEKSTSISAEPAKIDEAIQQIHSVQKVAGDFLNTSDLLIKGKIDAMKPEDDSIDKVTSTIESIIKNLADYQYAVQIFDFATLIEVQIKCIINPDELAQYKNQICKRVNQYKDASTDAETKITEYINNAKALNEPNEVISILAEMGPNTTTSWIGAIGVWAIAKAFKYIDDKLNKRQADKKEKVTDFFRTEFSILKASTLLDSPAATIDLFISTADLEKEYVIIGNDYYTNIPSA